MAPVGLSPRRPSLAAIRPLRFAMLLVTFARGNAMKAQIVPMLAVSDGNAAIDFYKRAFGAELLWRVESGGQVVAGKSIRVNFRGSI
jgi:hypothetical protein